MIVGILKEPSHETRVSLLPEAVASLQKKGIAVVVATGAGERASAPDSDYTKSGARVAAATEVVSSADIILCIHPPDPSLQIPASKILIGVYQPLFQLPHMQEWAARGW